SVYRPVGDIPGVPAGLFENSAARLATSDQLTSQGAPGSGDPQDFMFEGVVYRPGLGLHWKGSVPTGMVRLAAGGRIGVGGSHLRYMRFLDDFPVHPISNLWRDTGTGQFTEAKLYAVQTNTKVIERCVLMTTDPGDLVLDPTCGSGT